MTDREKLIELIADIENEMVHAYPYTTDTFRIEETVKYLIANGATVQRWIPVTERLPRNYIPVLCYIPSLASQMQQTVHECHIGADGEWHSSTAPAYREKVTHWMPMPEPPKED